MPRSQPQTQKQRTLSLFHMLSPHFLSLSPYKLLSLSSFTRTRTILLLLRSFQLYGPLKVVVVVVVLSGRLGCPARSLPPTLLSPALEIPESARSCFSACESWWIPWGKAWAWTICLSMKSLMKLPMTTTATETTSMAIAALRKMSPPVMPLRTTSCITPVGIASASASEVCLRSPFVHFLICAIGFVIFWL